MSFYLAIVSPLDSPLYEITFQSSRPPPPNSSNTPTTSTSTLTSTSTSTTSSSFPSWSSFTSANGSDLSIPQHTSSSALPQPSLDGRGNLGPTPGSSGGDRHLLQMIAHSSLDVVEEIMEGSGALYLKSIDRHNEWNVSAFLATNVKFILLHDVKNEDGIRLFFIDIWESYVKVLLNPFHTVNTPIRNPSFESKVRASAKRNL